MFKRFCFFVLVAFFSLSINKSFSQNFSNKGTDFWITYPFHIDGTSSIMGLYLTSDANATGNIQVNTTNIPFSISANTLTEKFIGSTSAADASNSYVYLPNTLTDGIKTGAAIHITSDNPIVVYAHIIKSARSGATLALPSNVWGSQYIVPSYRSYQTSSNEGYGTITVVAKDTNTTFLITPTVQTLSGKSAGVAYPVTLTNPGDVYQVQFKQNADISGTLVQSVSNGSGCKKIAVYSSSSWSAFDCTSASSGDNLYQQLFPVSTWGQNYICVPGKSRTYDIFRVFVSDPAAVVKKTENGVTTTLTGIINNSYYEYKSGNPTSIQSNLPVSVVQYFVTEGCINSNLGDPEMIELNPIEQTINNITVFSAHQNWINNKFPNQSNVNNCYLNIIIPTAAANSFKINGNSPVSSFYQIPSTNYSYLQEDVTAISLSNPVQSLKADSNFIAIAYGYGNVESYGYNAGTNVIDLYTHINIRDTNSIVARTSACKSSNFNFALTLPYMPDTIKWAFNGSTGFSPNTDTVIALPVTDSSYISNGKQLYVYKNPVAYYATIAGTYTIYANVHKPTSDGCGQYDQISYAVSISDKPTANFGVKEVCLKDSSHFIDSTVIQNGTISKWQWVLGDGSFATIKNPVHLYTAASSYNVGLVVTSANGCVSDTVFKQAVVNSNPTAGFKINSFLCEKNAIVFADTSKLNGLTNTDFYWNMGNGVSHHYTNDSSFNEIYSAYGNDTVHLKVTNNKGCSDSTQTIIHINPLPKVGFTVPQICMIDTFATFHDTSSIVDSSQSLFSYSWNFNTGSTKISPSPVPLTSTINNPTIKFFNTGNYGVQLTVTSKDGCKDSSLQSFSIIPNPVAAFTVNEVCLKDSSKFIDNSVAQNSTITKWQWFFGDGGIDSVQNPVHLYSNNGKDSVKLIITNGIGCVSDTTLQLAIVNALPSPGFNISSPFCEKNTIAFTDTSKGNGFTNTDFYWNMGNGDSYHYTNSSPFNETYSVYGDDTVHLKVTNNKGCSDSTQTIIHINPLPKVGFTVPQICLKDALASFQDTSSIADSSQSQFTYLWNFNAGSPKISPSPSPISSTSNNPTIRLYNTGNYGVQLIVTSKDGCKDSLLQTFAVNGSVPVANFIIANNGNICSIDSVKIKDISTVDIGNLIKLDITWDTTSLLSSETTIDNSPVTGGNKIYPHLYTTFSPQTTVKRYIKLYAYSGVSCVSSKLDSIMIYATPKVKFDTLPSQCSDAAGFQITQAAETGGVSGNFSYYGAGVNSAGWYTPSSVYANTYSVTAVYTSNMGCKDSAAQNITIYPLPTIQIDTGEFVLTGYSVQLQPKISGQQLQYLWAPSTYLNDSTIVNPITTPTNDITYRLLVTGIGGCTATASENIYVIQDIFVPTAFTPNGDGKNDVWEIKALNTFTHFEVFVYDRLGYLVFHTKDANTPWNGYLKGKLLDNGTYVYYINIENGKRILKGTLVLIR